MKMKYADTDNCPIAIELTLRELTKLIALVDDAEGPFRSLKASLHAAHAEALESAIQSFQFERNRLNN